jgi:Uma2 family endonuclease
MSYGIEPDDCFYIHNHRLMIGKDRVDLSIDPPPDLAIEVDVTSKTQMDAYLKLGVAELWIYGEGELKIYTLHLGDYQLSSNSDIFKGLPVLNLMQNMLDSSVSTGRSPALRDFRQAVRSLIQ